MVNRKSNKVTKLVKNNKKIMKCYKCSNKVITII